MQDNPPSDQILSVSSLTDHIKLLLEGQFESVWVRGEVSNLRRQSSGHIYFSIKDVGAQISAVVFKGNASKMEFPPRDGQQIIAFGRISVYPPRGGYQLIVSHVLEDGVGRLQREFERLKQLLADEGLFDVERKKSIPALPKTIGIVTSPTGAALRDFVSILQRRNWSGRLVVLPARVQGVEAAGEIVQQIKAADALGIFDLLVLSRGGGSLEDLWPFNEEVVVRAVAACNLPVISAVGHEIDFVLTDFAADKRAETPSAAAELISSGFLEMRQKSDQLENRLSQIADLAIERYRNKMDRLQGCLRELSPRNRIEHSMLRLDDLQNRLNSVVQTQVQSSRNRCHLVEQRFNSFAPEKLLTEQQKYLKQLEKRLNSVSPKSVLNRGFAYVQNKKGKLLSQRKGIKTGTSLTVVFRDGELSVQSIPEQQELF
jgi:exodeoxyribonuclease VII large subunit